MVVGVGVVLGCREMERGLPWPTIARSSSFWARVASILGHLLKAAVYVLPALTVRHKATSVHRNPGSAFPENKHHIWWECLLKKIVKKKKTNPQTWVGGSCQQRGREGSMLSGKNTWPVSLCQLALGEVVGMWWSEAPGF